MVKAQTELDGPSMLVSWGAAPAPLESKAATVESAKEKRGWFGLGGWGVLSILMNGVGRDCSLLSVSPLGASLLSNAI